MYYETINHSIREVGNAMEAAELIRGSAKPFDYECIHYTQDGKEVFLVSDIHIDGPSWFEVAVIIKQDEENFSQIESITNGWIETTEKLGQYFKKAVSNPCAMGRATLIIGRPKGTESAWFTCGCCGNYFKDNVKKQQKYDQDNGYGICSENGCNKYYD